MISLFTFKYPDAVVIPSNVEYEVVSARDICVSVILRFNLTRSPCCFSTYTLAIY